MKYLKLSIRNLEPLCISDDSTSQSGQTKSSRYIPGSTIRGYVINTLSKDWELFEKNKDILFSAKICFLNAYPCNDNEELIPSLKGFYENKKTDGDIRNVVIDGEFDEGMKRAGLGQFCHIQGDTIKYYNIEAESVMKILTNAEEKKVFRGEYIVPGYLFTGYISFEDDVDNDLMDSIKAAFDNKCLTLGNRRSQGFGKCRIEISDCVSPEICVYIPENDIKEKAYMILLSHMTMRDKNGEYCGIDMDKLEKEMGVSGLKVEHASTSMVTVHGYNSTLGIKLPTVPMYEQGSVFKLSFEGTFSLENMKKISDKGIGIRKNEGFGRVLFLDDSYSSIVKKEEGKLSIKSDISKVSKINDEDREVLKIIAGFYYRRLLESAKQKKIPEDKKKMRITKSQAGTVLSILEKNRYSLAVDTIINRYFSHAEDNEDDQNIQKERVSIKGFSKSVKDILETESIGKVLGIDKERIMGYRPDELITTDESKRMVVGYVIDLIKYAGKED